MLAEVSASAGDDPSTFASLAPEPVVLGAFACHQAPHPLITSASAHAANAAPFFLEDDETKLPALPPKSEILRDKLFIGHRGRAGVCCAENITAVIQSCNPIRSRFSLDTKFEVLKPRFISLLTRQSRWGLFT